MSPGAAGPGAEVSRCDVPQHRVVQRLIGHQPLQPTVLALQFFQPLGLVDPQPPVLPPPAVIRWLGHAEAARDLRDRFPLREHHLRLPQFADDLLGRGPLACHADSLRTGPNPRTGSGPVLGGQVSGRGTTNTHTRRGSQDNCGCRRHIFGEALTAHIVSGRGVCPEPDLGLTFVVVLQRPSAGKCFLRGSPARAGIDLLNIICGTCCLRFPRSRGDRPCAGSSARRKRSVPPLARG